MCGFLFSYSIELELFRATCPCLSMSPRHGGGSNFGSLVSRSNALLRGPPNWHMARNDESLLTLMHFNCLDFAIIASVMRRHWAPRFCTVRKSPRLARSGATAKLFQPNHAGPEDTRGAIPHAHQFIISTLKKDAQSRKMHIQCSEDTASDAHFALFGKKRTSPKKSETSRISLAHPS